MVHLARINHKKYLALPEPLTGRNENLISPAVAIDVALRTLRRAPDP
jgi:hypothetical protein